MKSRKGIHSAQNNRKIQGEADHLIKLFNNANWRGLEQAARAFMQKYPGVVLGAKAFAVSLMEQGNLDAAKAAFTDALILFPQDAELHNNLAAVLIQLGQCEEAITCAEAAIRLAPQNGGAYANRGLALKHLGAWAQSLDSYYKAIELDPTSHLNLNNAGVALLEMEKYEPAITCFKAALELNPNYQEAKGNLGRANEDMKLYTDAKEIFNQLLDSQPDNDEALARLVQIYRTECDFPKAAEYSDRLIEKLRSGKPLGNLPVFGLLCVDGSTREDQRIAALAHAIADKGEFLAYEPLVSQTPPHADKRPLKIGYLSADMHHHATMMLLIGVLEAHDKKEFEIYCYSHGPDDESELRKRTELACNGFRNIRPLPFPDAARVIAKDEIDILVDLKGYTRDERLKICAQRPAPIIVSWLGYPGTLGHPRMADYIIGDPIVTPVEHQAEYSEILAQMPHCYQPNDDQRIIGHRPSRTELGLPENGLVFCSFNQSYKITERVFTQWCRLLAAVPDSVLWLMGGPDARTNLRKEAAQRGIDPDRLVFANNLSITEHLGRLQQADLALDTFPYGSHTTGSDALWASVPLVAIKGETFASRVSTSLLTSVGLSELVASSPEAACDLAIELARSPDKLNEIRNRLTLNRKCSPLYDTKTFCRDLERMYREIWRRHVDGDKTPIVLTPQ